MSKDPKDEIAHRNRINRFELKVRQLYESALQEFSGLSANLSIDPKKIFSFSDYPATQKRLKEILKSYAGGLQSTINKGTSEAWYAALDKKDTKLYLNTPNSLRSKEALQAFQQRVSGGLKLSDRVWRITEQFQQEFELVMSTGLIEGKSAAEMARATKHLLKEPDKVFRRVRDKHGILQLSKKAKAYNPGQGVYRSSYKNAVRLNANEINIAYRTADHLRWKSDPTVVGFEVKLSNRHKVRDMCDDLKGKYPKDFKFVGWHTSCLCFKVPILVNDDDFDLIQQATLNGEELPKGFKPANQVNDLPDGFKDWVKNNTERSKNWKSQPYFIQDNFKGGKLDGGFKIALPNIAKEKPVLFELTQDIIDELKDSRNIRFWGNGTIDEYNKILSGFNLRDFDKEVTELFGGYGIEIKDKSIEMRAGKVTITYESPAQKGQERGFALQRTFYFGKGLKTVDHNYFELPDHVQGGGISKKLFNILYREYNNTNVEILKVHANIDIGGYTWGKYGFAATDKWNLRDVVNKAKTSLSDADLKDFEKWYENCEQNNFFPMNEIANRSYGKNLLLGTDWYGSIDLRDKTRRSIFESYLFSK
ncbi:hypothetical protein [Emticicia sp. BO119]|uniref:hypothetical protein n=1 Tax=Emticicia sp. BO119 TaxID=2757768 RepID=UPI0015F0B12C|nr:hypothetical protein [Emticicia sp. BO119]MBA4852061.1 hypothetical protein [Emticicia sp. BO119]